MATPVMNPSSYSTVGDPAEQSYFPNAVFFTPILTEDAVEKTSLLEDSTLRTAESSFIDILADKYPLSTTLPCPSASAYNLVQSDFICDFARGEFSCMLYPQVVENAPQDYPQPTLQSFSPESFFSEADARVLFPVNKSLVPDFLAPDIFDKSLPNLQFIEGGVKESQKLIAYGDHMSSEEETRSVATERENSDKMDYSFCKRREVDHQSRGKGEIGREHGRLVYPEHFEQPEMFINDVSATLTADIGWQNEPAAKIMNICGKPKEKGAGTKQRSRSVNKRKLVDLRTLLIQCAEAVGGNDFRNANDFLMQIKNHSSPFGNASQRKAHYFTKALEARLAGSGSEEYAALVSSRIPTANIEACKLLLSSCPFMKVSNFLATEMIMKLAKKATRIHIIHFGVPYGLQWKSLIQRLSTRPGNPPMLRVTGIDLPQVGLESAARVEETGHFLANCCQHFNIPFEYNAVTKKWESIQLEDLKIGRNEVIVVNCLYRLRHLLDETADLSSPRDTVLNLVRKLNPDIFIHGIVNGSYNAPFFVSRFREALYYFSTMFDMLEEIVPSEYDQERVALEENIYRKEILNVVACEGSERVERPETYKQWQVRHLRAGLLQLPLNQDMLKNAKAHVKLRYHKDFLVDEDKNWMLQGWKGRILFALSFWRPAKKP
ncbi:scarecrow-like protein 14 [Durio zibethinus]|uniref:Scarecrow-like protein 14 n=1 Tax=Durio zibethinus TaxID=66656 RepID=A0A6P5XPE5_DURZI|nr:scarecrow-like protein 14 [Durio zibethinus]XP_022730018.1 scarecrow-like protein 14 [Durio zibethinus]